MERVLRNRLGVSSITDDKEAVTPCGLGSAVDEDEEDVDAAAASGIDGTKNGIRLNILSSLNFASFVPDAHHDAKLAKKSKIDRGILSAFEIPCYIHATCPLLT